MAVAFGDAILGTLLYVACAAALPLALGRAPPSLLARCVYYHHRYARYQHSALMLGLWPLCHFLREATGRTWARRGRETLLVMALFLALVLGILRLGEWLLRSVPLLPWGMDVLLARGAGTTWPSPPPRPADLVTLVELALVALDAVALPCILGRGLRCLTAWVTERERATALAVPKHVTAVAAERPCWSDTRAQAESMKTRDECLREGMLPVAATSPSPWSKVMSRLLSGAYAAWKLGALLLAALWLPMLLTRGRAESGDLSNSWSQLVCITFYLLPLWVLGLRVVWFPTSSPGTPFGPPSMFTIGSLGAGVFGVPNLLALLRLLPRYADGT